MRYAKIFTILVVILLLVVVISSRLQSKPTTSSLAGASQPPTLDGCPIFPNNNVWNVPVTDLPVDSNSADYITSIGATTGLHPDFGSGLYEGGPIGIPYTIVPSGQPKVAISFDYADESDAGPYPIPPNPPIEGGSQSSGDRHILVIEQGTCKLYETWSSQPNANGTWHAGSGAVFDLRSNNLRPADWTSADAAGLPILPGLVRHDEVAAGVIKHALRFTVQNTRNQYLWPARHQASSDNSSNLPAMGQRFRLKANFDSSGFSPDTKVILTALKTYGMIVADNGSNWYISGTPDEAWDNDVLHELDRVQGQNFEAVNEVGLQVKPDSAEVAGRTASLDVWAGSPQAATINTTFGTALQARVTDNFGNVVTGTNVTFTVGSTSGASASFGSSGSTAVSASNLDGVAISPALVANAITGTFTVNATVSGVITPSSFSLHNLAPCPVSNLIVTDANDDGSGVNCGTLSHALLLANSGTLITFTTATVNVNADLPPVKAGVTVSGQACHSVTLTGSTNHPALILEASSSLKNLTLKNFGVVARASAGSAVAARPQCLIIQAH